MQQDFRERRKRNVNRMRMVKDVTMAVFILAVAGLLFMARRIDILDHVSDGFRISLGVLFTIYGVFRLYRGIKGDY